MFETFPQQELHEGTIDQACQKLGEKFPGKKLTIKGFSAILSAFERPKKEMPETESKKD